MKLSRKIAVLMKMSHLFSLPRATCHTCHTLEKASVTEFPNDYAVVTPVTLFSRICTLYVCAHAHTHARHTRVPYWSPYSLQRACARTSRKNPMKKCDRCDNHDIINKFCHTYIFRSVTIYLNIYKGAKSVGNSVTLKV